MVHGGTYLCVTVSYTSIFITIFITVTHVATVCDENMNCTRTMKCLYAVAKGIWLIDYQCM